ncbi:MAG: DUF6797 domain-containing protein [Planctomycetota bacterium]
MSTLRIHLVPALAAALCAARVPAQDVPFYERMDFGPFLSQTISCASDGKNTALKGVAVRLGEADRPAGMLFDTELLRVACTWTDGFLVLRGTPFDGSHGPHSRTAGTTWLQTAAVPGWSLDGEFDDPRPLAGYGPLPRSLARYRGLHRGSDRIVFDYEVGGARVLDSTITTGSDDQVAFVRSLSLAPCKVARTLLLADSLPTDNAVATATSLLCTQPLPAPELVTMRRIEGSWSALPWGAAHGDLPANEMLAKAVRAALDEGAEDAAGNAPRGRRGRASARPNIEVRSLPAPGPVQRIHVYAEDGNAAQRFTLYGSDAKEPPADPKQWHEIAQVDSGRLGAGGRHGVAIASPDGKPLGTFAHLLFVSRGRDNPTSLRFVAVEALGPDHKVNVATDEAVALALRGTLPSGARMGHSGGRVTLTLPPHSGELRFDLLSWRGDAREADRVLSGLRKPAPLADLAAATKGGKSRFAQTITVKGQRSADDAAYVVDDIPVPFDNPYGSWMRLGGFDFFADGTRAALSTWNGDVWVVSGIDDKLDAVTWKRFASGLFDPLGLRIVDDLIYVHGRDGITRLRDLDGDGEADSYECFNHDVLITEGFHEFAFDLQTDPEGNFYFSKAGPVNPGGRGFQKILPHHGCILKVSKDGEKLEVYATGFRANNGIGVGPQGQVTSGDNEGTWMPKCRLSWVTPGSFNGCVDTAHRDSPPTTYDKPLCWFPHDVDNSSGGQVWVTSKEWGPLQGKLMHMSYGTCSLFEVMYETVDGQIQGGAVRLPLSFASSCMRARFNPKDGQLYVCGLKGWQTSAARDGAFQRVRYTGKPIDLPVGLQVQKDGVLLTFSDALDPETANDPSSFDVEVWNYIWGDQYGSPHVSTVDPEADMKKMGGKIDIGYRNSDKLRVTRAELRGDRQVFVGIEGIRPVMQMQIKLNLDTAAGATMKHTIWNTIHNVPK